MEPQVQKQIESTYNKAQSNCLRVYFKKILEVAKGKIKFMERETKNCYYRFPLENNSSHERVEEHN